MTSCKSFLILQEFLCISSFDIQAKLVACLGSKLLITLNMACARCLNKHKLTWYTWLLDNLISNTKWQKKQVQHNNFPRAFNYIFLFKSYFMNTHELDWSNCIQNICIKCIQLPNNVKIHMNTINVLWNEKDQYWQLLIFKYVVKRFQNFQWNR